MKKSLKKKRILIFLRSFEIGGAERQAMMLANYLKREEKAKVAVWAYSPPGPILKLLDKDIPHKSIPFDLESQKPGNEKIRKKGLLKLGLRMILFRPHILMPFTITPNVDCGYVWRWMGAKGCVWNQRDEFLNFFDKEIENFGFHNTPVYVSNSKKGKQLIEENLKDDSKPVYHISNAVKLNDPKKTRAEWRKELKIDEDQLAAVMVANLHEFKDHENIIRAWKTAVEKSNAEKKPVLLLAGRFEGTKRKLRLLSEELGIEECVKFLDFVEDIPGLLGASDIGIFSSRSEGCPNGVLECMAAGLPVVATDIDGTREALGDEYKYLVPTNNPQAFAEKIIPFLIDEQARKKIGQQNKKRIEKFFSPEKAFEKYSNLLKNILSK